MQARGREWHSVKIARPSQGTARPDADDMFPGPLEIALPRRAAAASRKRPTPRQLQIQDAPESCRASLRRREPGTGNREPLHTARCAPSAFRAETDIRSGLLGFAAVSIRVGRHRSFCSLALKLVYSILAHPRAACFLRVDAFLRYTHHSRKIGGFMKLNLLRAGFLIAVLAIPVFAQNPASGQAARILGTIDSFNGQILLVKSQDGQTVSITIPSDLKVMANAKASLADIKPGDFVGSAADKGPDGKLHAEEVHIFPESMRGTGEGHRPMGPDPNRTMTNGTVSVAGPQDRTMTNGTLRGGSGGSRRTKLIQAKD